MSAVAAPGPLIGRNEFERMQAAAASGARLERMEGYVYAMELRAWRMSGWLRV